MRHRILTIEDQPDIRRLIRMTLEFKGYEVIEADDGEHGLRLARQQRPDLILLDVMMPGINGLEGQANDVQAGLATGVRAYLVKPFSPWELLALAEKLVAGEPEPAAPH